MTSTRIDLKKIDNRRRGQPLGLPTSARLLIYSSEAMLKGGSQQEPLKQVANVATLPGILKASLAMPDMHWGYGFPIGGLTSLSR